MTLDVIKAVFLGIVEGLTEYLPVSSTGHLLLVGHFLGFDDESFGKSFDVLIQLGAILALLSIYFTRLWRLFLGMFTNRDDQLFVIGVLLAFLPAMIIGAFAYSTIKSVLFNVWIVCSMLVVGGFILLWIDRLNLKPRYHDATSDAYAAGRGAKIPTMVGAFVFEAYKSRAQLSEGNLLIIAVGFAVSFVCGWFVVKTLLGYVARHGFALFAWWRIAVGGLGLLALAMGL